MNVGGGVAKLETLFRKTILKSEVTTTAGSRKNCYNNPRGRRSVHNIVRNKGEAGYYRVRMLEEDEGIRTKFI